MIKREIVLNFIFHFLLLEISLEHFRQGPSFRVFILIWSFFSFVVISGKSDLYPSQLVLYK